MRKSMVVMAVVGVLVAGCGSGDSPPSAATVTPEPAEATPTPAATAEPFEEGHSRAVRRFYGGGDAPVPPGSDIEAEYHQPPRPATGAIGDTITLTGTNIGVRLDTTVDGLVDPAETASPPRAGDRYVGVDLSMESTGIAIHDSPLESARLRYDGGAAKPVFGVEADCSHGFDAIVRIEVGAKASGCLLFQVPESAEPRELVLALEQVPFAAGGRWRLD